MKKKKFKISNDRYNTLTFTNLVFIFSILLSCLLIFTSYYFIFHIRKENFLINPIEYLVLPAPFILLFLFKRLAQKIVSSRNKNLHSIIIDKDNFIIKDGFKKNSFSLEENLFIPNVSLINVKKEYLKILEINIINREKKYSQMFEFHGYNEKDINKIYTTLSDISGIENHSLKSDYLNENLEYNFNSYKADKELGNFAKKYDILLLLILYLICLPFIGYILLISNKLELKEILIQPNLHLYSLAIAAIFVLMINLFVWISSKSNLKKFVSNLKINSDSLKIINHGKKEFIFDLENVSRIKINNLDTEFSLDNNKNSYKYKSINILFKNNFQDFNIGYKNKEDINYQSYLDLLNAFGNLFNVTKDEYQYDFSNKEIIQNFNNFETQTIPGFDYKKANKDKRINEENPFLEAAISSMEEDKFQNSFSKGLLSISFVNNYIGENIRFGFKIPNTNHDGITKVTPELRKQREEKLILEKQLEEQRRIRNYKFNINFKNIYKIYYGQEIPKLNFLEYIHPIKNILEENNIINKNLELGFFNGYINESNNLIVNKNIELINKDILNPSLENIIALNFFNKFINTSNFPIYNLNPIGEYYFDTFNNFIEKSIINFDLDNKYIDKINLLSDTNLIFLDNSIIKINFNSDYLKEDIFYFPYRNNLDLLKENNIIDLNFDKIFINTINTKNKFLNKFSYIEIIFDINFKTFLNNSIRINNLDIIPEKKLLNLDFYNMYINEIYVPIKKLIDFNLIEYDFNKYFNFVINIKYNLDDFKLLKEKNKINLSFNKIYTSKKKIIIDLTNYNLIPEKIKKSPRIINDMLILGNVDNNLINFDYLNNQNSKNNIVNIVFNKKYNLKSFNLKINNLNILNKEKPENQNIINEYSKQEKVISKNNNFKIESLNSDITIFYKNNDFINTDFNFNKLLEDFLKNEKTLNEYIKFTEDIEEYYKSNANNDDYWKLKNNVDKIYNYDELYKNHNILKNILTDFYNLNINLNKYKFK